MHAVLYSFFFFFFPGMWEAVIAMSDVMERPAALMGGRKPVFKWAISTCSHTHFLLYKMIKNDQSISSLHDNTTYPNLLALFQILSPLLADFLGLIM